VFAPDPDPPGRAASLRGFDRGPAVTVAPGTAASPPAVGMFMRAGTDADADLGVGDGARPAVVEGCAAGADVVAPTSWPVTTTGTVDASAPTGERGRDVVVSDSEPASTAASTGTEASETSTATAIGYGRVTVVARCRRRRVARCRTIGRGSGTDTRDSFRYGCVPRRKGDEDAAPVETGNCGDSPHHVQRASSIDDAA
jgi:hypothetical protein